MRMGSICTALLTGAIGCSSAASSTSGDAGSEASGGATNGDASARADAPVPCSGPNAGEGYVVDPLDGKCKLDGTSTDVGAPCTEASQGGTGGECGSDPGRLCLGSAADPYPDGYCTLDCSAQDGHLCPIGSSCMRLNGEGPYCLVACSSGTDCRSTGYTCLDLTMDPNGLWISGGSRKVCSRAMLTCPGGAKDCPTAFPRCGAAEGGANTPVCTP
jgi:hypothetical protein